MRRPGRLRCQMSGEAAVLEIVLLSRGPEYTVAVGRIIGGLLIAGDVLALSGPLGAGKTHLVKGIAAGLGVPGDEPVVSPTFVLVREYAGRLKLFHVDAYRLAGVNELLSLGFEEMCAETGAAVAVEWADRVAGCIPAGAIRIEMSHEEPAVRRLCIGNVVPAARFSEWSGRLSSVVAQASNSDETRR